MAREKFWCGAWAGGFVRELMTIAVLRNKSGDKSGSKQLMAFVGNPLDKANLSEECYPEYEFNEVSATANVARGYFSIGDSLKAVDILDSLIQYFNSKSYTAKYDKHNDRESILSGYISINMLSKVESLLSDEPFYYYAATELLNKYMELGKYRNALALIGKSTNNGSRAIAIMNMYRYLGKMSDSLDDSEWAIVRSFVNALPKDMD
jgi:hypothetical protein